MITATRIFLALAAIVLAAVGGMLTFAPSALYHDSVAALSADLVLSSDIRSAGTFLLGSAAAIAIAASRNVHVMPALVLTAIAYIGYGVGRGLSVVLDDGTNSLLVAVTAVEWAFGLVALGLAVQLGRGSGVRDHMLPA